MRVLVAPVMFSVAVVAPLYTPPLVMLLNVAPPFTLTSHWYDEMSVPAMVKLVFVPSQMVAFDGLVVMAGGCGLK